MQSPYTLWLHVRELVQLERITFRADLLSEEICSSYCSESDTFLMNYTTLVRIAHSKNEKLLNFKDIVTF